MHYQRLKATGTTDEKTYPITCSVDGCEKKTKSKGLCITHYTRLIRHGKLTTNIIVNNDKERLTSNAKQEENGCWNWQKFKKNGYGVSSLNGKVEQAHRASWTTFVGEIPDGMQINHKCNNRACINPDHLYIGTQKQNMDDMKNANRANPAKGESSGMAKLKEEDVFLIRKSKDSRKKLAEQFGVSLSLINAVKNNKIWRHI
jgi:hypothetical protein